MLIAGTILDLTVKMQLFCYQNSKRICLYLAKWREKNEHQTDQHKLNAAISIRFH